MRATFRARDRDGPQSETPRLLVEHPHSRTILFEQGGEGEHDGESGVPLQTATDTHAEAKLRRRVLQRDFDRVSACHRVRHRPFAADEAGRPFYNETWIRSRSKAIVALHSYIETQGARSAC
jgi:hypothetical protein